jgi:sporulation protein YlmC with PRC-barrel domain
VARPAGDYNVRGRKVLDNTGKNVGTVEGLMVDDVQNKVRFLQVECGGFLGLGATHVLIPVDAITRIGSDEVTIDRGGEHLRGAPRYDPALVDTADERYWHGVYGYYGFAPFWGMGYMYPPYPLLPPVAAGRRPLAGTAVRGRLVRDDATPGIARVKAAPLPKRTGVKR